MPAAVAEKESASSEPLSGIAHWRVFYRDRLASHVIETKDDEQGWQEDPIAVTEFRKLLEDRMASLTSWPQDDAVRERITMMQEETEELLQGLHESGTLEELASGTTRALNPSEISALNHTLAGIQREQSEALPKDWDLDQSDIFMIPPKKVLEHYGIELGKDQRRDLERSYLAYLMPWIYASAEQSTLRSQSIHLALEQGILPPPSGWLPDILPRFGELEEEKIAYEEAMRQVYGALLMTDG